MATIKKRVCDRCGKELKFLKKWTSGIADRKIIFLDIDGVLNSIDYFEHTKHCKGYSEINPKKVKLLKEIVDRTGAEIVLSSTWRDLAKRKDKPLWCKNIFSISFVIVLNYAKTKFSSSRYSIDIRYYRSLYIPALSGIAIQQELRIFQIPRLLHLQNCGRA